MGFARFRQQTRGGLVDFFDQPFCHFGLFGVFHGAQIGTSRVGRVFDHVEIGFEGRES